MSVMLEYKGYFGSVEFSAEDEVLHGLLKFIRDLVTYEGRDAEGIKAALQEAVDDYLELCEAEGRKPDVPLKGQLQCAPRARPASPCDAVRQAPGDQPQYCRE